MSRSLRQALQQKDFGKRGKGEILVVASGACAVIKHGARDDVSKVHGACYATLSIAPKIHTKQQLNKQTTSAYNFVKSMRKKGCQVLQACGGFCSKLCLSGSLSEMPVIVTVLRNEGKKPLRMALTAFFLNLLSLPRVASPTNPVHIISVKISLNLPSCFRYTPGTNVSGL